MVKTILVPESEQITISVPHHFVGKRIELLAYEQNELEAVPTNEKKTFGNSGLLGSLTLTDDRYHELQSYLTESRNECHQNF